MWEAIGSWVSELITDPVGLFSVVLSIALVALYWKQHTLLRRQMNRDVRKQHTETLRKRIRAWHGDLEEVGTSEEILFRNAENLPIVQAATVTSAPPLYESAGDDPPFRVVPAKIENDRYLQDLLENHATDLRELKNTIEGQYQDFQKARASFIEEFDQWESLETEDYTLEPKDRLAGWAFEQSVKYHRENREIRGKPHETDKDRLRSLAATRLQQPNSRDREEATLFYSPENRDAGPPTYKAALTSGNMDDFQEVEDEIPEDLADIHSAIIDDIDDSGVHVHAIRGAKILDTMEEDVEELRMKLVEYEGHTLYPGDCEYIEEASV